MPGYCWSVSLKINSWNSEVYQFHFHTHYYHLQMMHNVFICWHVNKTRAKQERIVPPYTLNDLPYHLWLRSKTFLPKNQFVWFKFYRTWVLQSVYLLAFDFSILWRSILFTLDVKQWHLCHSQLQSAFRVNVPEKLLRKPFWWWPRALYLVESQVIVCFQWLPVNWGWTSSSA